MIRTRNWLIALFVIGLALRLAFALLPLDAHLVFLEDDAWMVAAIARNFVLGRGITADGLNPTNGFQPLYPLTIGAMPWVLAPNNLDLAFTLSLVLTAILNALTVMPLYGLARKFTDKRGALIAIALFALNPFLIRISVNAMETSLGLLLLTTMFYAYYSLAASINSGEALTHWKNILLFVFITALAALARLDALLGFGALGLAEGLRALWNYIRMRKNARPIFNWLAYGALTMIILAPYFYRNATEFGSLEPTSSRALAYMHSYAESFAPWAGVHILFANPALNLSFVGSLLVKLVVLALLLFLVLRFLTRAEIIKFGPLFLFAFFTVVYYGYILQHNVTRYYVGMAIPFFVLDGWLASRVWARYANRIVRAGVAFVSLALVGLNSYDVYDTYSRSVNAPTLTQPTMYRAALWVRDNLEPSVRLGAVNSGIFQYYSNHVVVNLDGKLNMDMVPVFEQRTLLDYLRAKQISYVVDLQDEVERRLALYDANFGNTPPHLELSLTARATIYLKLIASSVGIRTDLRLDDSSHYTLTRPLNDALTPVQTFPRPNDNTNPIVLYKIR